MQKNHVLYQILSYQSSNLATQNETNPSIRTQAISQTNPIISSQANIGTYPRTGELPRRSVGAALSMVWVKRAGLVTMRPPALVTRSGLDRALVLLSTRSPAKHNTNMDIRTRGHQQHIQYSAYKH